MNSSEPQPEIKPFTALWDTGATMSVITQKVIDACGLKPTGSINVSNVENIVQTDTFLVNFWLPNKVVMMGIPVSKGKLPGSEADVLVGMDIINKGDFAVTNWGSRTKFSFRIPSRADIDFVKEDDDEQAERQRIVRSRAKSAANNRAQSDKRRRAKNSAKRSRGRKQ